MVQWAAGVEHVDSWVSYSGRYKCADTFACMGPWIVTADEIADPHALAQRDAKEAERRVAHERRMLADVDRERVAAKQAAAELAKEQKARAAEQEAAHAAQAAAEQTLQAEKAAHREAAAAWSKEQQEMRVELATQLVRRVACRGSDAQ